MATRLKVALAFLLGFATAAVLHAWLSAPQAVIYWTVPAGVAT